MSAKVPRSLTDENADLRKHMGCMNGIFQLFDRHHFLVGRRVGGNNNNNHKRLTAGPTTKHVTESNSTAQKAKEKSGKEALKENERVPTESSTSSFSSSSCSSTFSSVDCYRTAQPELSSCSSIFPETPSEITRKQPNSPQRLSQKSLDLRDVVKESMYREPRGLSVKTTNKEDRKGHVVKYIDSPRPSLPCKSAESHRNFNERKDLSLSLRSKDGRRFSYDGRESRDAAKSNTKLKELPRLSLDSRADYMRRSESQSRPNHPLRSPQLGNGNSYTISNMDQEPGSNKRPSGVVAKLMGLEALPDSTTPKKEDRIREIKACPDLHPTTTSSTNAKESKQSQVLRSPRIPPKDPVSPRLRTQNSDSKTTSSSRFPLEPAPWKQPEGRRTSQRPAFTHDEALAKVTNVSPSVYGAIEERLKELEFNKSSKNLRALKQILEAMQKTRERPVGEKQEHTSSFEVQASNHNGLAQRSHWSHQSNHPMSPTISSSPRNFDSLLVIVKTVDSEKQTAKDLTPRYNRLRDPRSSPLRATNNTNAKTMQILEAPQFTKKETLSKSGRSSRTMSPRLQQKVLEMENQSSPTAPSSELKRGKRQSRKQPTESSPQSQSARPNPPTLQQRVVQLSETSSDRRSSSCQDDAMSVQSESRTKLSTNFEVEVTSTGRSNDFNDVYQPKGQKNEENLAARLSEDKSLTELRTVSIEQPSPVSVLDATFYREGSPSPVKKISNAFKDDNSLTSDGAEWNSMDLLDDLLDKVPNLDSKFNRNELKNTMNLVQKLKEISSLDGEATLNDTASLFQNMNEEHRYIAEIMLVSGILFQDPATRSTTIHLHPPGHVINPNLFLVLERTKRSTELHGGRSNSNEKIQRKLIFDAVEEILVNKAKSSDPWISRNKLITRSPSGMKLLGEVCSEIDHIQPNKDSSPDDEDDSMSTIIEDFMNQSENWADYCSEVPEVVIDIERQIFKDLIVEAVIGEAVGSKGQPSKYCRQLFSR